MFLKSNRGIRRMESARIVSPTARSSPLLTPLISLHYLWNRAARRNRRLRYTAESCVWISLLPLSLSQINEPMMVQLLAYHPIILLFMIILWLELGKNQCKATPLKIFQDGKGPVKEEPPTTSTCSGIMGRLKNSGKLVFERCCKYFNESTTAVETLAPPQVSLT